MQGDGVYTNDGYTGRRYVLCLTADFQMSVRYEKNEARDIRRYDARGQMLMPAGGKVIVGLWDDPVCHRADPAPGGLPRASLRTQFHVVMAGDGQSVLRDFSAPVVFDVSAEEEGAQVRLRYKMRPESHRQARDFGITVAEPFMQENIVPRDHPLLERDGEGRIARLVEKELADIPFPPHHKTARAEIARMGDMVAGYVLAGPGGLN